MYWKPVWHAPACVVELSTIEVMALHLMDAHGAGASHRHRRLLDRLTLDLCERGLNDEANVGKRRAIRVVLYYVILENNSLAGQQGRNERG